MTKFLLLNGKLIGKKPKFYCALHKCGINDGCMKRRCPKCRHFRALSDELAHSIMVSLPRR